MIKKPFHYFATAFLLPEKYLFLMMMKQEINGECPEVITHLGFLLFNNGCTWFKEWFLPEGGFEGGQKLQGEKPVSSIQKANLLK